MKVLFVCSGNVGGSQMAEAFYNLFTVSNDSISAGVDPSTPIKYPKLAQEVIDVMNEENIDVSSKKVKYIKPEMMEQVSLVVVMCDKKLCPKYLLESKKVIFWEIKDPYQTSKENFRVIRNQIKVNVLELLNK